MRPARIFFLINCQTPAFCALFKSISGGRWKNQKTCKRCCQSRRDAG